MAARAWLCSRPRVFGRSTRSSSSAGSVQQAGMSSKWCVRDYTANESLLFSGRTFLVGGKLPMPAVNNGEQIDMTTKLDIGRGT
jgi:hypothetical protein